MRLYLSPRMLLLLWLGVVSGLPLALTASTLTAWFADSHIDIKTIGLLALTGTPYAIKFLWAPLMDGIAPPWLGRIFGKRRGWMFLASVLLAGLCAAISRYSPAESVMVIAMLTLALAFVSASFDINMDALRIEILTPETQAAGVAMAVLGYRIGMLVSSAGALYLSEFYSWSVAYQCVAWLCAAGMIAVLLAPQQYTALPSLAEGEDSRMSESEGGAQLHPHHVTKDFAYDSAYSTISRETQNLSLVTSPANGGGEVRAWIKSYLIEPFAEFSRHHGWQWILLFIILFKLGDAFLGFMTNPFLLDVGYSKSQIASVVKIFGFFATIAGGFLGGWIAVRMGTLKSLWLAGILQAVANLPYAYLAILPAPDVQMLALTISVDNLCSGISTVVFVAYLSGLCNLRFTATQYALLNSLASVGRTVVTAGSGWMVASLGWPLFFITTALMGVPALWILHHHLTTTPTRVTIDNASAP